MEAVPRLPMLSFNLKISTENPSFGPKLKQYIRDFYNEDPEMYSNEIHNLEGIRAQACTVGSVSGCLALKKYYCQLHFLQSRFPMAKDGAAAVPFTWQDTYTSVVCTLTDIRFEMVCILYNIGALHSQLGASDSRVSSDGMKMCCTHFQCAAWAFQHLKDTYPQPAGVDLAPNVMLFMYHLTLAQAQECILEKSMMDNRKATIIAKVAIQVVDYYNLAMNVLEQSGSDECSVGDTVGSKVYKNWKRYVKFKIVYHSSLSLLYHGQQAEEQQKMGERVAFYQAASDKLKEAMKLSKGMEEVEAINEALAFTMDVIEGKKKAAKNENEFIYHEEVPDRDSLHEVKGASLVKGIPFNVNDPDISGQDIFARLVPMKAHEASSLYSEEKAKLRRRIGTMIDDKDQELVSFMSSLQLDHLNLTSESDRLPQELVDRCAALSAQPNAIQSLIEAMNKLADTYHDVEGMLQDIKELLETEEMREKEYQEMMGTRPPSIVATDLTREANKYQEAHAKASESNQTLHKAMTLHITNLRILAVPLAELEKQIPTTTILNTPNDEASLKEMRHLVGKVEEMKQQRSMLANNLRAATSVDDITTQLVTRAGESLEAIFNQEMQKHQRIVATIEQNLSAQDNILKALTEAYARYAGTRKATIEIMRNRETTINALISSYDAYEDLLAKSSKGLEFYRKLETNVTKLLQRVKGTCKVQDEEREQILAKNFKTVPSAKTAVEKPVVEPVAPSRSGPKLKDYLQGMKMSNRAVPMGSNATGSFPNAPLGQYYNASYAPPSASPLPSTYYDHPSSQVQGEAQQWVPSVRPAPVGQEGSEQTLPTCYNMNTAAEPKVEPKLTPSHSYAYPTPNVAKTPAYPLTNYNNASVSQQNYIPTSYPSTYTQPSQTYQQEYPMSSSPAFNYTPQYNQQYQLAAGVYPGSNSSSLEKPNLQYPYAQDGSQYSPTIANASIKVIQNNQQPQNLPSQVLPKQPAYSAGQQQNQSTYSPQPSQHPPTYQAEQLKQPQNLPAQPIQQQHTYPMPSQQSQPYFQSPQPHHQQQSQTYYPSEQPVGAAVSQNSPAYYLSQQAYPSSSAPLQQTTGIQYNAPVSQASNIDQVPPSQATSYPGHPGYSYNATTGQYDYTSGYQSSVGSSYNSVVNPTGASEQTNMWTQQHQQPQYSDPSKTLYGQEFQAKVSNLQSTIPVSNSSDLPLSNQQYPYVQPVVANNFGTPPTGYQYNTNPADSRYTSAGNNSNQTSSTQSSVSGPGYSDQYNTNYQTSSGYNQGNYYNNPYAGVSASPSANSQQPVSQQSNNLQHQQSTFLPQRAPNTMTASMGQPSTSLNERVNDTSNIDLLAGLDFNINQAPLTPQQPAVKKSQEQLASKSTDFTKLQNVVDVPQQGSVIMNGEKSVPKVNQDINLPRVSSPHRLPLKENLIHNNLNIAEVPIGPEVREDNKVAPKGFIKDPYGDPETLNQFVQEVEKYEKFVDGLTTKTLNGPTPLDMKWKELLDLQERDSHNQSISVARCYPMKNRFPDILPYDNSRVELPSTKDDYINASFMKNLTNLAPPFIVTQAPLHSTYSDFWTMIWEQQIEVVVCLLSDAELQDQVYWPVEKNQELAANKLKLTLQSSNVRPNWVERIVSMCLVETRVTRVIVHLQFTAWPGSSFPPSPGPFLGFVSEALNFYNQQRAPLHPVVVHCLSGVGRTGLFCLITAALCEIQAGRGLLDLVQTTATMSTHRKGSLRDREHLKFAYQSLLYYAQDMLMKIVTNKTNLYEKPLNDCEDPNCPQGSQEDISSSVGSSGRSSPLTRSLVDLSRFNLKNDNRSTKSRKRYTKESFSANPLSSVASLNVSEVADDPLSQLDPLWQMK